MQCLFLIWLFSRCELFSEMFNVCMHCDYMQCQVMWPAWYEILFKSKYSLSLYTYVWTILELCLIPCLGAWNVSQQPSMETVILWAIEDI